MEEPTFPRFQDTPEETFFCIGYLVPPLLVPILHASQHSLIHLFRQLPLAN